MKRIRYVWTFLIFSVLAACGGDAEMPVPTRVPAAAVSTPTATTVVIPTLLPTSPATLAPPASPTPVPTAVPPTPTALGPCQIIATRTVDVYQRPSREAGLFGTLDATFRPEALAQTADAAWIGFDPAVAQAANVGVFRLRWVAADAVTLEGGCNTLPVVEGPPPGVCFTMPMTEVSVYALPEPDADTIHTLVPGDYTAVTGYSGQAWARVDLAVGNADAAGEGWVERSTLNLNGPCELPEVSP